MTFQPVIAGSVALSRRAALPCGCVGVVLGRDGADEVLFGVEAPSPQCPLEHATDTIALVNAGTSVTPVDLNSWDAG
jgi:hypothetical protein